MCSRKSIVETASQLDQLVLFIGCLGDFFEIGDNKVLETILDEGFIFTGVGSEPLRQFEQTFATFESYLKYNGNLVIF